jgi:hypothetical protein
VQLTRGNYRGVLDAVGTGQAVAPGGPAAVQLHAQKAKAWARVQLWYCRSLAACYVGRVAAELADELNRVIEQIQALARRSN